MQAILLAAGKGSRLHPYTDSMPKPLVPVKGKSMLLRLLDQIVEVGINDITIVTGYRAEQIEKRWETVIVVYRFATYVTCATIKRIISIPYIWHGML